MKTKKIWLLVIGFFTIGITAAQSSDDLVHLLIQKGLIKQHDIDSIHNSFKQQEIKEKQNLFSILSSRNITIDGYTQLRYQSLQESGKADGFDIRRARLDIKGTFSPEWEYRLQTEFAISTKIIDAYIVYNLLDNLKLTGGQFLIPNSLESMTSDTTLETIDRAQVTGLVGRNKDALGDQNGRDIGLQASGSILKTASNRFLLDYYLAYLNGQGINVSADENESKDIALRVVAHPYTFLDFGLSYSNGHDTWTTTAKNQDQIRIGADLAVHYNNLSLRSEYLQAQQGTYTVNEVERDLLKNGWYLQVGYFILPKKFQLVAKYDTYDATKNNPIDDISTFYTLGSNLYPNSFVKCQVNYKHKVEEGNSSNKDEIVAQIQLKF
jgi:phosphate-selective porin